jgi:hypothetical protein
VGRDHLNFIQQHKSGHTSIIVCKMLAQFACSALERVGPNNNNDDDIAVVDVAASKPIIKKSSIGGNGKSAFC